MCQHRHSPLIWGVSVVSLRGVRPVGRSSWGLVLSRPWEAGPSAGSVGPPLVEATTGQVSEGDGGPLPWGIRQAHSSDQVFAQERSGRP